LEDEPSERGSIIDEIQRRMERFPQARVERDACSIAYLPAASDGFVVRLTVEREGTEYCVHYNGARQKFTHRGRAVVTFGFGLSTGCRLREYRHGGNAYRWVVEIWDLAEKRWKTDWEDVRWQGVLFWRRSVIFYLQNRLIEL
jgi:hypothetical protein